MKSKDETKVYIQTVNLLARFSERISKLPVHLQEALLADLETALENRLKIMERVKE
jgi:hypothetical protein